MKLLGALIVFGLVAPVARATNVCDSYLANCKSTDVRRASESVSKGRVEYFNAVIAEMTVAAEDTLTRESSFVGEGDENAAVKAKLDVARAIVKLSDTPLTPVALKEQEEQITFLIKEYKTHFGELDEVNIFTRLEKPSLEQTKTTFEAVKSTLIASIQSKTEIPAETREKMVAKVKNIRYRGAAETAKVNPFEMEMECGVVFHYAGYDIDAEAGTVTLCPAAIRGFDSIDLVPELTAALVEAAGLEDAEFDPVYRQYWTCLEEQVASAADPKDRQIDNRRAAENYWIFEAVFRYRNNGKRDETAVAKSLGLACLTPLVRPPLSTSMTSVRSYADHFNCPRNKPRCDLGGPVSVDGDTGSN
ncbi:MAG TPA: hypothetical protein VFV50_03070 [Bdellovibrionales bacterium]|nr:hypothetical protein [Bdellovibrionales bacterium]